MQGTGPRRAAGQRHVDGVGSEQPRIRSAFEGIPARGERRLDRVAESVREPAQVASWIDVSLFSDPLTIETFETLAASASFHEATSRSTGPVLALLEQLAVEEPVVDGEPETLHARLVVSLVEPAGERWLADLLRQGDDRAMVVKPLLDRIAHARNSDWAEGEEAALQLVAMLADAQASVGEAPDPADGRGDEVTVGSEA